MSKSSQRLPTDMQKDVILEIFGSVSDLDFLWKVCHADALF
jgi:hypothetical protein